MHVLMTTGLVAEGQRIVERLRTNGHRTEVADTGEDILDFVQRYSFDVVVMSLSLPDMRGTDLIRRIQDMRLGMPILALSPTPHPAPRVEALDAGADDVMVLPLDEVELCARLRALVRRSLGHPQQVLSSGSLSINLSTREVTVNALPVHLTAKEVMVLELLMLRCGSPVSKEWFLQQLYVGIDQEPELRIVDVFVCKLRRKLTAAGAPDMIETLWGRGYIIRKGKKPQHAEANGRQIGGAARSPCVDFEYYNS